MHGLLAAAFAAGCAMPAWSGQVLHAAPDGVVHGRCVPATPCTLGAVQQRARVWLAQGDAVTVVLQGGTYRLHAPLRFDARDSGTPAHPVRWQAAPGARPVFDGSTVLRGERVGDLWQFALPDGATPTSVYVASERRWPARTAACPQCTVDARGLANVPAAMLARLQVGSMAVLHARWRDFRCRVIALGAGRVDLAQPCWHNAALDSKGNGWAVASPVGKYYGGVNWFENLAGTPTTPGSYTVDAARHVLFHRPLPAELGKPPVLDMPVLTALLVVAGTPAAPVHDLVFSGIGFAGTDWQQAATDDGYVSLQAGYLIEGAGRHDLPDDGEGMTRIASAVTVRHARDMAFDRVDFRRLAAAGIALVDGTHDAAVTRSRFTDIGGGAIFVGDTIGHPQDPAHKTSNVVIADNRIDHVARAYRDNVAIMAGFVSGLAIAHNTISDLPYSGISVGWGWDFEGDTPVQSAIHIVANRIDRVMLQLADGGAIYTQGQSTPGTSCIVRNAIDIRRDPGANGIYLDEHSTYFDVERNVILGSWVSAWAPWSGHLRIVDNWTDTAGKPHITGSTKVWAPNFTRLTVLPADARAVQRAAGVRANAAPPAFPIHVPAACPRSTSSFLSTTGVTP